MPREAPPRVRPVVARPGAAYRCFGDGLCCTDIHGLGPVEKNELVQLRRIDPNGAGWDEEFESPMLRTAADGGCFFLLPDRRCSIHAEHGPEHKPDGCRRFPLGLTATPHGGRITTRHRCPCRTLGARPPVTEATAFDSISNRGGRLHADTRVSLIPLDARHRIRFEAWREIEAPLLAALAAGKPARRVLGAKPFPSLRGSTWIGEARGLLGARDGTQFGVAAAWFADAIFVLVAGERPRSPGRPWAAAFDRAERRRGKPRTPAEVINDWVADEIWALEWAEDSHFARKRAELVTRLTVAEHLLDRLLAEGLRPDRAAAEAVMIAELIGDSDHWSDAVAKIRLADGSSAARASLT